MHEFLCDILLWNHFYSCWSLFMGSQDWNRPNGYIDEKQNKKSLQTNRRRTIFTCTIDPGELKSLTYIYGMTDEQTICRYVRINRFSVIRFATMSTQKHDLTELEFNQLWIFGWNGPLAMYPRFTRLLIRTFDICSVESAMFVYQHWTSIYETTVRS